MLPEVVVSLLFFFFFLISWGSESPVLSDCHPCPMETRNAEGWTSGAYRHEELSPTWPWGVFCWLYCWVAWARCAPTATIASNPSELIWSEMEQHVESYTTTSRLPDIRALFPAVTNRRSPICRPSYGEHMFRVEKRVVATWLPGQQCWREHCGVFGTSILQSRFG